MKTIAVQSEDFDVAKCYQSLREQSKNIGAIVTFTGLVRDFADHSLQSLTLEHYPGMAEKVLNNIADEAIHRFSIEAISITHRYGELTPNEQIVLVGVASAHRGEAFQAAEFSMDILKTQIPFWKKETTSKGSHWIESKAKDDQQAERWLNDSA